MADLTWKKWLTAQIRHAKQDKADALARVARIDATIKAAEWLLKTQFPRTRKKDRNERSGNLRAVS